MVGKHQASVGEKGATPTGNQRLFAGEMEGTFVVREEAFVSGLQGAPAVRKGELVEEETIVLADR